jgi:hypothetical protein
MYYVFWDILKKPLRVKLHIVSVTQSGVDIFVQAWAKPNKNIKEV